MKKQTKQRIFITVLVLSLLLLHHENIILPEELDLKANKIHSKKKKKKRRTYGKK